MIETIEVLLEAGAPAVLKGHGSPAHTCARMSSSHMGPRICATLAAHSSGRAIDCTDGSGRTPLMEAARYDNFRLVEYLVRAGAGVNRQDTLGQCVLVHAMIACCESYHPDALRGILRVCLKAGADPLKTDADGETVLMMGMRRTGRGTEAPEVRKRGEPAVPVPVQILLEVMCEAASC
jgi:hypothetical protein